MKARLLAFYAAITASLLTSNIGFANRVTDKATVGNRKAMLIQKDYEALTGRWQLVKSIVDGKPVPEEEVRKTILITDHNLFRLPADAHVGTAPQGRFTIDPTKTPKTVDSVSLEGPNKGQITRGIYEILDANNKRACWGPPGGARPTDFSSAPGSGRILQYWRLISKAVS